MTELSGAERYKELVEILRNEGEEAFRIAYLADPPRMNAQELAQQRATWPAGTILVDMITGERTVI